MSIQEAAQAFNADLIQNWPDAPFMLAHPEGDSKVFYAKALDDNFDQDKLKQLCSKHSKDGYVFKVGDKPDEAEQKNE